MSLDDKKINFDYLDQSYILFLKDLAYFMGESFIEGEGLSYRLKETSKTIENLLLTNPDDIEALLTKELNRVFMESQQDNIPLFIKHLLDNTKINRECISKKKVHNESTSTVNTSDDSNIRDQVQGKVQKKSIIDKPEFNFYFCLILAVIVVITIIVVKAKITAVTPDRKVLFENSDTVIVSSTEEPLNGNNLVFDDKFLNNSKQIIIENVEKNFRQNIDSILSQHNLKADTSISSNIQNGYLSFKDKRIQYALCESTAHISIPSLKRHEEANYTSAYIISLSNNKLIQTQCVIKNKEKELVLKKACKDEILNKHKIVITQNDLSKLILFTKDKKKTENKNKETKQDNKNSSLENTNFEKESLDSLLNRALSYENSGNYLEAEKIYKYTSMHRGNAYSFVRLGLIYLADKGLVKDKEQAYHCFYNAAALENTYAQWMLGQLYEHGIGIEKNIPMAVIEYHLAANKNFIKAQVALGDLYSKGEGIEKDLNKAAYWYNKAQSLGDREARIKLNYLMKNNN